MSTTPPPEHRGWYPDPYVEGSLRWFDGSEWTTHAVKATERHPDEVVEKDWDPRTPEEMRTDEWREQFPWWDTAIPQSGEPGFDYRGGVGGFTATQGGRFDTRLAQRLQNWPIRTPGWVLLLCGVPLLMAWGDPPQRPLLWALATALLACSLGLKVRARRIADHWKRVGQED